MVAGADWSFGTGRSSPDSLTDAALLQHIGERLRDYYGALAEEPLPERLRELVDRFEGAGRRRPY